MIEPLGMELNAINKRTELALKALRLACKEIAEATGSCPYDCEGDDAAISVCKQKDCRESDAPDCWQAYFLHKAREPE